MKRLLLMLLAALLAFASFAEAEGDVLWLYWTVDASVDQKREGESVEFYGANLYVVEDGSAEGRLVSTKWANDETTVLTGANELGQGDQACGQCLMSDITGVGIGAQFYVELLGASQETVGWWTGEYMTMEELASAHEALTGMVAGLQTGEPFHHVHGGEWVANRFSTVPEPTSGLLVLIGAALMALRRRKMTGGGA